MPTMIGAITAGEKINDFAIDVPLILEFKTSARRKEMTIRRIKAMQKIIIVFLRATQKMSS